MRSNELNTPKDLEIGTILSNSFNGMTNYYEVIGTTEKSVKLREIRWETCAPDPGMTADGNPTYRAAHLVLDEKGNTVPELDWQGKEKIYRKMVHFLPKGGFCIPSVTWGRGCLSIFSGKLTEKWSVYWS